MRFLIFVRAILLTIAFLATFGCGGGSDGPSIDQVTENIIGDSIIWGARLKTSGSDKWNEVEVNSADEIIVGGYTGGSVDVANPNQGVLDSLIAKYSENGELIWARQFGVREEDKVNALTIDNSDNILVAGFSRGSLAGSHKGSLDGILAKFSSDGELLWIEQTALSTPEWDYMAGVSVDGDDNVFVVGYTEGSLAADSAGFRDFILAKFSPLGSLLWRRQFGGPELDAAYSIGIDSSGNAFITGFTRNSLDGVNQGQSDAFVAKYIRLALIDTVQSGPV
jgi:hypothetical protein